jgi:hypothetical protein
VDDIGRIIVGDARLRGAQPKALLYAVCRVSGVFEHGWTQLFEELSFYLRLVGRAHELYDDTLCPRCAMLSGIRAAESLTDTFTDRVDV